MTTDEPPRKGKEELKFVTVWIDRTDETELLRAIVQRFDNIERLLRTCEDQLSELRPMIEGLELLAREREA